MRKGARNCYLTARMLSDLKQLMAAEMLGVDSATLREYESGRRRVPDDIVVSMMDLYHAEWLGYKHLRNLSVGKRILPAIDCERGIAACAINALLVSNVFSNTVNQLLEIADDDYIDQEEEAIFGDICVKLKLIIGACMAIAVREHKKEPHVLAHERFMCVNDFHQRNI